MAPLSIEIYSIRETSDNKPFDSAVATSPTLLYILYIIKLFFLLLYVFLDIALRTLCFDSTSHASVP